ncbi:hypothetical protein Tco_0733968 [Tanacetum coccineum]
MHLPHNSLQLRHPKLGKLLTQEKLLKQKSALPVVEPVDDIPIPDAEHILDSKDIGVSHIPKIHTRPDWLKLIPEEDRPETPEPDLVIPLNDLPKSENNWAATIAKSYKDPEENKYKVVSAFHSTTFTLIQMEEVYLLLTGSDDWLIPEEIVLHRAAYKEYNISEADFKNLHLNDYEDLYLLHLQGKLNHLSGADKVHLFNAVNQWIMNLDDIK